MSNSIDYEALASDYAANRSVHPVVFQRLAGAIQPIPGARVLEIGCGTGNYIGALQQATGAACWGIDPAAAMLAVARTRWPEVTWRQGSGEDPPCPEGAFDCVFNVDVAHHLRDPARCFAAAAHLLVPGGWICTVTDSERIIVTRQPLAVYFPESVAVELERYRPIAQLTQMMTEAGFIAQREETVEFTYALTDLRPYRERAYSVLRLIGEAAWQQGLERMAAALTRGPIPCVARYTLLWGRTL